MEDTWIYHERQEAQLCGQHALNNLVQEATFTPDQLAEIAHQLDAMELTYMSQNDEGGIYSKDYLRRVAEGSGNVDPSGNFSIEVLRSALLSEYGLSLPNIRQEGINEMEVTNIEGFICNKESHWFAIRKINGTYWNLNSTLDKPQQISHFRLAAEIQALQTSGYSVFCVAEPGLPPPCTSLSQKQRGLPEYWWKEEDLLKGKSNPSTGAAWKNLGTGMKLGSTNNNNTICSSTASYPNNLENLSEDDMLRLALEASLKDLEQSDDLVVQLTPEPDASCPNSVKIQFRLPGGVRSVRRFLSSDNVAMLYAYVNDCCMPQHQGKRLELLAGFPPKDLAPLKNQSILSANLANESIQARYL